MIYLFARAPVRPCITISCVVCRLSKSNSHTSTAAPRTVRTRLRALRSLALSVSLSLHRRRATRFHTRSHSLLVLDGRIAPSMSARSSSDAADGARATFAADGDEARSRSGFDRFSGRRGDGVELDGAADDGRTRCSGCSTRPGDGSRLAMRCAPAGGGAAAKAAYLWKVEVGLSPG